MQVHPGGESEFNKKATFIYLLDLGEKLLPAASVCTGATSSTGQPTIVFQSPFSSGTDVAVFDTTPRGVREFSGERKFSCEVKLINNRYVVMAAH
ncbi:hypothetical protein pipiens_017522 [Culex pipiens pipiens]|uniref:Uncharacterized protein n=1 Tax=Culex pipiens pipiens TaxID=38569 RepID=A0ABD1CGE2_CULPP